MARPVKSKKLSSAELENKVAKTGLIFGLGGEWYRCTGMTAKPLISGSKVRCSLKGSLTGSEMSEMSIRNGWNSIMDLWQG